MKKIFLLLIACGLLSLTTFSQVGIGTTTPDGSAMLDVKSTTQGMLVPRMTSAQRVAIATPAEGLKVYDTDTKTFWFYNGSGWAQTNYWTPNGINIFNNNSGNVGIGTSNPLAKLHVAGNVKVDGANTIEFGAGVAGKEVSAGKIGYQTFGTFDALDIVGAGTLGSNRKITFWNEGSAQFRGNVGIGIANANNKLQIGSLGATGFSGNDIAIGNGTNALGIFQSNTVTQFASSTNIVFLPNVNNGQGNVGINISNANNKLQIGSVGPTGFNGNDIAIGNGTNAAGFFQSNSFLQVASSTDIALMPRVNGTGRVGINTTTPRAPLDVVNNVSGITNPNLLPVYAYFTVSNDVNHPTVFEGAGSAYAFGDVSIIASNRILASEFDAYSDARIKNIVGISNTAKDLGTINALRITDYIMKDKVKYGNKRFKKVIAQEVEKVYPQVVSKHTDFIPNVYQLASNVEKVANGYQLHFDKNHNINNTAKKLQVVLPDKSTMQQFDIVAIPDDKDVIIDATDLKADKIFVYGEEVNDFRTVDYEGLTTLNISATQELSKQLKKQQAIIELLEKRLLALEAKNK